MLNCTQLSPGYPFLGLLKLKDMLKTEATHCSVTLLQKHFRRQKSIIPQIQVRLSSFPSLLSSQNTVPIHSQTCLSYAVFFV